MFSFFFILLLDQTQTHLEQKLLTFEPPTQ